MLYHQDVDISPIFGILFGWVFQTSPRLVSILEGRDQMVDVVIFFGRKLGIFRGCCYLWCLICWVNQFNQYPTIDKSQVYHGLPLSTLVWLKSVERSYDWILDDQGPRKHLRLHLMDPMADPIGSISYMGCHPSH